MVMKNILITGIGGFIGYHVGRGLLEQGYFVTGVDNLNNYYDHRLKVDRIDVLKRNPNFSFRKSNICNKIITSGVDYDCVIHLAAQAGVRYSIENPSAYVQSNLVGFSTILEWVRSLDNNPLFLYASSSSVYGKSDRMPLSENDTTDNPISLYAATKKSNEVMAYSYKSLYGIRSVGMRFFSVYGPWGRPDMAPYIFTKSILNDEEIKIFNHGNMKRDFTYVSDIVDGIIGLMLYSDHLKYDIYNIGSGNPVNLLDFVEVVENILGIKSKRTLMPLQDGDVLETYADISRIKNDVFYEPKVDIQTGMKKFVEWYLMYGKAR
jgi:UDP-glucuronate 4-epimerase